MASNTQMTDPAKSWLATIGGFAGLFVATDMTDSFIGAIVGMIIGAYAGYIVENILVRILIVILGITELILKSRWFWSAVLN